MAKLNTYVEKNTLYKEAVLLIEKELDNIVRELPYDYIRDNEQKKSLENVIKIVNL